MRAFQNKLTFWVLLALVGTTGCGVASYESLVDLHAPDGSLGHTSKPATLAVVAEDNRPEGAASSIGSGFLVFIPLVPYGKQNWTPERMKSAYNLPDDIAAALAKDLRATGLFREVVSQAKSSAATPTPHYTLAISLNRGSWVRYYTTYGLSIAGVALWYLGAPEAYGHNEIGFHARLLDTSGAEVAEQDFFAEASVTESNYQTLPFGSAWGEFYTCFREIAPEVRTFVEATMTRLAAR